MPIPPAFLTHSALCAVVSKRGRWALGSLVALGMALTGSQAQDTATTVWSGATNTTWGTAGNWSAGVPTSGTVATFNSTFSNQPNYSASPASVAGLWLATGVGQNVTITGNNNVFTLAGTATINGNANTAILLDDTANRSLSLTAGTPIVTLTNSTRFLVNNAGTLSLSKVNLNGNTLTLGGTNASGNVNISGVIGTTSPAGSLIVNTAGTVTLSAANTFTGGTTLTAGTLVLAASTSGGVTSGPVGIGTLTLAGGTVRADGSGRSLANTVSITGDATLGGTGGAALTFTGAKSTTGDRILTFNTTVTALPTGLTTLGGNLTTQGTGGVTISGGLALGGANRTLTGNTTGATTISGPFSSSSAGNKLVLAGDAVTVGAVTAGTNNPSIEVNGAGTYTFNGASTYTTGTTLAAGTLILGASSSGTPVTSGPVGTGTLTLAGGTIRADGSARTVANVVSITGDTTFGGAGGAGPLTLSGAKSTTGDRTLTFDNTTSLFGTTGLTTLGGNLTTQGTGGVTISGGLALGGADRTLTGNTTGATTISGALSSSSAGNKLVLSGDAVTVGAILTGTNNPAIEVNGTGIYSFNGASTYTGGTIITGGTLRLGNTTGLGTATGAFVTFGAGSSGKLQLNGFSPTIVALNSDATVGTPIIENSHASTAATLTVNTASANTYAGVLQDGGVATLALTKTGAGTLTLSGANTYTGATNIQNGAISVSNIGSTGSASSNLGAGSNALNLGSGTTAGTLIYTGTGETSDRVINLAGTSGGGVLDQSGTTGLLKFTSTPTAAATNKTLTLQGSTDGTGEFAGIIANGTNSVAVTKAGTGTWIVSGANTYTGATNVSAGILRATTTASALGAGALTMSGGELQLAADTGLGFGRNTTVNASSQITVDRITAGTGVNHTLGTLAIGAQTLTVAGGTNVTGGTAGLIFGNATLSGNSVLDVSKPVNGGTTKLTLGTTNLGANTLTVQGAGDTSLGSLTGTGGILTKSGTGSLTLRSSSSHSGGTILNGGTLILNSETSIGTGTLTLNGGTLDTTAPLSFRGTTGNDNASVWNGDFAFAGSNGSLNLGIGAVNLGSAGAAGSTRTITVASSFLNADGLISNGATGTGINKDGAGFLILGGARSYSGITAVTNGTLVLGAASSGSGGVRVDGGTLDLRDGGALGTGTLTINGGNLDAGGGTTVISTNNVQVWNGDFGFTGSVSNLDLGNGAISLGTATGTTRTLNIAERTLFIRGVISDGTTATGLIKTGAGNLFLSGTNTFSGGFTFGGGELQLASAGAVGTGVFTINEGAILDNYWANGITTTNNGLVINGNFSSLGRQTLLTLGTGDGNLGTAPGTTRTITTESGSSRELVINNNIADGTTATGIIKAGGGELTLAGNNTFTGGVTVDNGYLNVNSTTALGTGTLTINGGNIANNSGAAITNANNNAQVWNSGVIYSSTSTGSLDLGTGAVSLGTAEGTTRTINVASQTNRPLTIGGVISDGTTATGIVKTGQSVLNLTGANTYTGTTTVNYGTANFSGTNSGGGAVIVTGNIDTGTAGTLNVNGSNGQFTNTTSYTVNGAGILQIGDSATGNGLANRLNTAATLSLGGTDGPGTVNIVRGSTIANSQSLDSLVVSEGTNTIWLTGSGGGTPVLTLSGATPYSRAPGGFVNFHPSLPVNFTNAPTGSGNVAAGLLVGGILNGNDFIRAQSGSMTATTYTADTWSSGINTNVTTSSSFSGDTGSLRFNTGGSPTLTLSGANTIESGGIIVGGSATSGTITGGSLQTGVAGGDLWIYINSGKSLVINSAITDNAGSSLGVGGTGTLTLTGANTYTGGTTIGTNTTLIFDNSASVTANNVQGNGFLKNNNPTGTLVLNQTGLDLSLGTVSGVSGSRVVFDGTGKTTIKNALNSAGQMVEFTGGTVVLAHTTVGSDVTVNGGTLRMSPTINKASGTQTLDLISGELINTGGFVMRANGTGATVIGTQTGGTFSITGNNYFQLGTNTSTTSTSIYNLSGGTFSHLGTGNLTLYADTGGNSSSTFNLSGGTLLNAGSISGNQGSGAKQAFVWTGGTLATESYGAANLSSAAGEPVSSLNATYNTLVNDGGTLAPGDIGTTGRTVINGNYAVTSPDAALSIDINGITAANAFQHTVLGRHDVITMGGSARTVALGGRLFVNLLGFTPEETDVFTILTGADGGISGAFNNTVAGSDGSTRIVLSDGLSSLALSDYSLGSTLTLRSYNNNNEWTGGSDSWADWADYVWTTFIPTYSGHVAKFGEQGFGDGGIITVSIEGDRTVGGMQFNHSTDAYHIEGADTVIFDNNGTPATVAVSGSHQINTPVALADNLSVDTAGGGDSLRIGGVISGTGKTLTKTGSGTLIFSGDNTYTGVTTVSAGTLQIGDGGTTGMVAGDILNNAQLVFDRSDDVIFAGVISGSGSLLQQGAGTLTLTAANSFTGDTTVTAGSLATGVTGSFGIGDIYLLAGASLTLGNNTSIADSAWLFFDATSTINLGSGIELLGGLQQNPGDSILSGTYTAAQLNQRFGGSVFNGLGSLQIGAIPEPATWTALAGLSVGLFALVRRRRGRTTAN